MNDFYADILSKIPDFHSCRCSAINHFETWGDSNGGGCRLILDYNGQFTFALVAVGVSESTLPVVSHYPYELGEFLIFNNLNNGFIILADELKGWRIVASSVEFEGIIDDRG
jgi:hypothetical protein